MAILLQDDLVIVPKGEALPSVHCAVCGEAGNLRISRKSFSYCPQWIYFACLLLWPGIILALILRDMLKKGQDLLVPLCGGCHGRWTSAEAVYWLVALGGIVLLPAALMTVPRGSAELGILVGFLIWFGAVAYVRLKIVPTHQLVCKLIDRSGRTYLRFPDQRVALMLKNDLGA